MSIFKTEIASDSIRSDNPIHQRLLKPYMEVAGMLSGDLLELGCGEGRGVDQLLPRVDSYLGLDKIGEVIERLKTRYPDGQFMQSVFPPVPVVYPDSFDFIVSFQVIEHVRDDRLFLGEIHRLLKPGGVGIITTPNRKKTLSRNPWHIREYTAEQLLNLSGSIFRKVMARGITGNPKVMEYYEKNRKSVQKIMKFDVLNLQYRLPAFLLKIPYEILNRLNRDNLSKGDDHLAASITFNDYTVTEDPDQALDLFYFLYK